MTVRPPADVGMPLEEVDTPALVIELDAFEANLTRMAEAAKAAGVRLRPHAKTHKCAIIALRQIALGAVGVCCQKVSEAEALVEGGVRDVLISNEIVGERKIAHLVALAREATLAVCVDDAGNVADLESAAARAGATLDVLVEVDVGAHRCGVAPGRPALDLAKRIDAAKALRFAGLQVYEGRAQHIRDYGERRAAIDAAVEAAGKTVALLGEHGLACRAVTGAGTGTYRFEAASGLYNELQAGSYIFMDADYAKNRSEGGELFDEFQHSLWRRRLHHRHEHARTWACRGRRGTQGIQRGLRPAHRARLTRGHICRCVRRAWQVGVRPTRHHGFSRRQTQVDPRPLRPDGKPLRLVRVRTRRARASPVARRSPRGALVRRSSVENK